MLLRSRSSLPNITVGLSIAWLIADARTASSACALPRKYGSGESASALVMLTCTTRRTPALSAARSIVLMLRTATSWVSSPRANRTQ